MWDLSGPGLEPVSPALAGRFSTTAPPGKPININFKFKGPQDHPCSITTVITIITTIIITIITIVTTTITIITIITNIISTTITIITIIPPSPSPSLP
ncbi:hypothetical protein J1605_000779 [Eschrichtius robustus]|uniref:Uncharacterized protein n=1 Tax=Eschrichtius robustus TaxID=9764 RepID=A0AB34GME5_ESCRO|nr:hypothetical protein J1605_000779 [Eschrichtius robustus]